MSESAVADPHADAQGHAENGHSHHPFQAHHFDTPQQQYDAGKFGMWIFLVQEVLFFSGLFVAYAIFRLNYPEIFKWGHQFLQVKYGAINTIVLLFSSLTAAWAVRCAQLGQKRGLIVCISVTLVCAFIFLGIKYIEYSSKFHEGLAWSGLWHTPEYEQRRLEHIKPMAEGSHGAVGEHAHPVTWPPPPKADVFFSIYFGMTGLHALHVLAGIAALTWLLLRSIRGDFDSQYFGPVDLVALYWHLVDLVWIYLFPMLYLIE